MLVYLCLGGNIGDTCVFFRQAKNLIEKLIGKIECESSVYQTEPWGFSAKQQFLNQVVAVRSKIKPDAILEQCMYIESDLGRIRHGNGYQSRCIDIDILLIDSLVIDTPALKVPHPLMQNRNFVLKPLCDVAPEFIHPILGKSIKQLLEDCNDDLACEPVN